MNGLRPVFANTASVSAPEWLMLRHGRARMIRLRVRVGVIVHPEAGVWLIDTGHGPLVESDPGRRMAMRINARLVPLREEPGSSLPECLDRLGLAPGKVTGIFVTHFHADHIARLRDFPGARIVASGAAAAEIRSMGTIGQMRNGIFPELIPEDLEARLTPVETLPERALPFGLGQGGDLFGDGSVLAVGLPGHAIGHHGLCFPTLARPLLYGCDVQWIMPALADGAGPSRLAHAILNDPGACAESSKRLRAFAAAGGDVMLCHDPGITGFDLVP